MAEFGVRADSLKPSVKAGMWARGALVHAAQHLSGYRLREIAAWLGYRSYAGAAKVALRFQTAATENPDLMRRLDAVIVRLEEGDRGQI